MKPSMYFIGVDVGTQALKVGIFNNKGDMISFAKDDYPTQYSEGGEATQNPLHWYKALQVAVPKAVKKSGLRPDQISSICVDGTSPTMLMVDEQGQPIDYALLWCDRRAVLQAEKIKSIAGEETLKYSGGTVLSEWILPKVLWIKENHPGYSKASKIMDCADWITLKLSNRYTTSKATLIRKANYNPLLEGWPDGFLNQIGLEDYLDKLPEIYSAGQKVGTLDADIAKLFGLSPETIIVEGGIDGYVGLIGMGIHQDAQVGMLLGSSIPVDAASAKPISSNNLLGPFTGVIYEDISFLAGVLSSGCSVLKWLKDISNYSKLSADKAYLELEKRCTDIPIGSQGLVCLPYWSGVKTPHKDTQATGALLGLTLAHQTEHIFRSVYEGLAYSIKHVLGELETIGYQPREVIVAGGGTKSRLFLQIISDTLGLPMKVAPAESTLRGSSILAAVGAGEYENIRQAVCNMTTHSNEILPDMKNHDTYQELFEKYRAIYPTLRQEGLI